jgi:hypothetical protein
MFDNTVEEFKVLTKKNKEMKWLNG